MEEVLAKILEFITSASGASVTIAVVLELVFRLIPSQKPLSIAYVVANFCKSVGNILLKVAELMDKVLPQIKKE